MSKARYWTVDEYARLDAMIAEGKSNQEIAIALGRSESSVCVKRNKPRTAPKGIWKKGAAKGPTPEERQPWKPGDPKPDWLRRAS
jgi:transposase